MSPTTIATEDAVKDLEGLIELADSLMEKDTKQSIFLAKRALQLADSLGAEALKLKVLNILAGAHYYQSAYAQALDAALQALEIAHKLNDSRQISRLLNNIANLHVETMQYEDALLFSEEALAINRTNNFSEGLGYNLITLSYIHKEIGNLNKAKALIEECLILSKENGNLRMEIKCNLEMAILHMETGDLALAEYLLRQALALDGPELDELMLADLKLPLGQLLLMRDGADYAEAHTLISEALETYDRLENHLTKANCLELLASYYEKTGNPTKALEYFREFHALSDSIFNEARSKQYLELKSYYEIDKKQEENLNLVAANQQKDQRLMQQQLFIGVIALMAVLSIGLAYLQFRFTRNKQAINVRLKQLNGEILDKNNKIALQNQALLEKQEQFQAQNQMMEEAMRELQDAQGQLVQAEKMASLGVLTAGVAHELNNPINYISNGLMGLEKNMDKLVGLLERLAEQSAEDLDADSILTLQAEIRSFNLPELNPLIRTVMADIRSGAHKASEIVRQLRTYSRIDSGHKSEISLHESIDSTLAFLRNQYKDRIKIHKEYGDIPLLCCFPGKLNQVFMNVLTNAIQSIEEEGHVYIKTTLSANGHHIWVTITDTGSGIPQHVIDKIFDPFFTTKEVGMGTGLGLSICKSIIEEHLGIISIESEEGRGTTALIKLPV